MGRASNPAHQRAIDERHLSWLRLKCEGLSLAKIAKRFGVSSPAVHEACNAIIKADIAESGDADAPEAYRRVK